MCVVQIFFVVLSFLMCLPWLHIKFFYPFWEIMSANLPITHSVFSSWNSYLLVGVFSTYMLYHTQLCPLNPPSHFSISLTLPFILSNFFQTYLLAPLWYLNCFYVLQIFVHGDFFLVNLVTSVQEVISGWIQFLRVYKNHREPH